MTIEKTLYNNDLVKLLYMLIGALGTHFRKAIKDDFYKKVLNVCIATFKHNQI